MAPRTHLRYPHEGPSVEDQVVALQVFENNTTLALGDFASAPRWAMVVLLKCGTRIIYCNDD